MDNREIGNIIQAGIVFIVYLFVMILLYYILSTPIDTFFDGLLSADLGLATGDMAFHGPNIEWALKLVFAIGISIPVTWFIFWIFSREPFMGMVKRY